MSCADVSVIIPTFNRLAWLQEAVESVLSQSLSPKQLIVVDDGSTDGTSAWLQGLSDARLVYRFQENQGPAVARNEGASLATGRFLAFLDSDDLWQPKKLEVQYHYMLENPQFKLTQTEEIWIRNGVRVNPKKKHQKPSGKIFEACLKLCLISPSAVMIEREFFNLLGGFDPEFPVCEDYELWLRAALQTPVRTLAEPLVIKRGGHEDQLSNKHWGMDRFRVRALYKTLEGQSLTPGQRRALLDVLEDKLLILSQGFEKHRSSEQNPYEQKLLWLQKQRSKEPMAKASGN